VEEEREHFYQWFRNKYEQRDTHIREAFRQTNERLDTSTRIDCMMSGTTVVVTLLYRNMIICANAGDSRAVMFSSTVPNNNAVEGTPRSTWKPVPLSRDHKPEDSDEAARIRACNGRVEQSKIMPGMALFGVNGKPMNNLVG
jgi:serine/threonine protein phosphatase PrpC